MAYIGVRPAGISNASEVEVTGDLTVDTNTLHVDAANNRVGVGTTSPSSYDGGANNLVIYEAGNAGITIAGGTANNGSIYFADGTAGSTPYRGIIQYNHSSDHMRFATAASEAMRIDSSGNVGIGTTSPAVALETSGSMAVSDTTTATKRLQMDSGASSHTINSANYGSDMMDLNIQAENLIMKTGLVGVAERMRIDSSGRITKPNQPAFLAFSTQQNNISNGAKAFTNEIFDRGSNYNATTGVFTAPVTGIYLFTVQIRLEQVDTAASYYQIYIATSNRNYYQTISPRYSSDLSYHSWGFSFVGDMDANDTATVYVDQSGGSTQTDIHTESMFSGFLLG